MLLNTRTGVSRAMVSVRSARLHSDSATSVASELPDFDYVADAHT